MSGNIEQYKTNKDEFMAEMANTRPDLLFPESWSASKKAKAAEMVRPAQVRTAMFASIPLVCRGSKCIFAEICPLLKQNLAPLNHPCPIEMAEVKQFCTEYMDELGVDPDNLIEVSMIRDLVDQEIQQQRKTWVLSQEHFIQENVVGIAPDGQVILAKQLHLAVELEDRLHKRKKALREQLLATREARAKVGQAQLDTAQAISNIIEQQAKLQRAKQKSLKAALGNEDYDDYIDADVVADP